MGVEGERKRERERERGREEVIININKVATKREVAKEENGRRSVRAASAREPHR